MKKSVVAVAVAVVLAAGASQALAQSATSTASGGAGGQGGAAAGGNATGGTATNNTSGVATSTGGTGGSGGSGGAGGTAQGGSAASNSQGGNVGTVSTGGSQASLGDVTVNFNQPAGALGKDGLGAGVDPNTGHIVTDNKVQYSGSYKVKNTPDVGIGGPASGPCNGFSAGIGFSVAGFGIGGNTSTVDEGCTARETARIAAMLGRMDIANAVLENLPQVQAAMRAKSERDAASRPPRAENPGPVPATTTPLRDDPKIEALREAALKAARELEQATREIALRDQQNQAQEALTRQATMAKLNDTLKFTDATTQGSEKTPQEVMAEEAMKKLGSDASQVAGARQDAPPPQLAERRQEVAQPQPAERKPDVAAQPVGERKQDVVTQQAIDRKQDVVQTQATTSPLPPQQTIPAPASHLSQQTIGGRTDGFKPGSETKAADKASQLTVEERMKAARAALNIQ